MSEIFDAASIVSGQPAIIVAVSGDRHRLDFRFPNGNAGFLTHDEITFPQEVGDIILIDGNRFSPGDISSWSEPIKIGVVRRIYSDRILIEDGYTFHLVPNRDTSTKIGQTVVYGENVGIREKLEDTPIVPRIGAEDIESDKYLWEPGPDKLTFDDFGGYPDVVTRARELIETPLKRGEELKSIGARPIRGVLFTGAPGTGKTHLARIIADQSDAAFYSISGPEVISKWVGDSEGNLRRLFEDAKKKDRAVVFFDEIDSLAEKRSEESHEASKRVVAQLLTLMDGFEESAASLMVIAATNRPDDIDPALRRPGRFDWEIDFPMPNVTDRFEILRVSMSRLNVGSPNEMPLEEIAARSQGWSAARLTSLWTEAALLAASDGRGSLHPEDLVGAYERLSTRAVAMKGGE